MVSLEWCNYVLHICRLLSSKGTKRCDGEVFLSLLNLMTQLPSRQYSIIISFSYILPETFYVHLSRYIHISFSFFLTIFIQWWHIRLFFAKLHFLHFNKTSWRSFILVHQEILILLHLSLFKQLSITGHFGYFQAFAPTNNAVMNNLEHAAQA